MKTDSPSPPSPVLAIPVTSKTPRTDAEAVTQFHSPFEDNYEIVAADFARQLELECAEWRRDAIAVADALTHLQAKWSAAERIHMTSTREHIEKADDELTDAIFSADAAIQKHAALLAKHRQQDGKTE